MKALKQFLKWELTETDNTIETPLITFEEQLSALPEELQSEFQELGKRINLFPGLYPGMFWEKSFDWSQLSDADSEVLKKYNILQQTANQLLNQDNLNDTKIQVDTLIA